MLRQVLRIAESLINSDVLFWWKIFSIRSWKFKMAANQIISHSLYLNYYLQQSQVQHILAMKLTKRLHYN